MACIHVTKYKVEVYKEALRQGAATGTGCRRRGIVGRRGRLGHVRLRVARLSLGSVAIPIAQAPLARLEDEARGRPPQTYRPA